MPGDQIIRIDLPEFRDGLADVVVAQRRNDMKSADHRMHFIYSGCGDRLPHGVDYAAVAARCQHHQAPVLDQKRSPDLVLEIVGNVVTGIFLAAGILSGKQPKPSKIPMISVLGWSGCSNEVWPIRPVVKAWSATSAGSDAISSDRSASRIAFRSRAPNWPAGVRRMQKQSLPPTKSDSFSFSFPLLASRNPTIPPKWS